MLSRKRLLVAGALGVVCAAAIAYAAWHATPTTEPPIALLAADATVTSEPIVPDERIGMQIEDFTLNDFHGQPHKLSDFADRRFVVVAFLGTDCPLVQQYTPRLMKLAEDFNEEEVAFIAINSNYQDSITEMKEFAETHGLTFPLLKDSGNVVADQFKAIRTPEIFVLDEDRRVQYWGRVDDEFGVNEGVGYQRLLKVRPDLKIALEELLAGKPVTLAIASGFGCHIGRIKESDSDSPVTWSKDIALIFQDRCQSCHRPGQIAPFSLLTYEEVHGWEPMIKEVLDEERMPPWHASPEFGEFVNDPSLTDEQLRLLYEWIAHGAPEGDPEDLPPPKEFKDGWDMEDPDLVINISDEPVVVPATGSPEFRYYLRDTGFTEGKWVEVECRPDNLTVIHHMDILVAPPGDFEEALRAGKVLRLTGYAPGINAVSADVDEPEVSFSESLPTEVVSGGRFIPAGSQLSFEMHYSPNGREQLDHSSVAFKFVDAPQAEDEPSVVASTSDQQAVALDADVATDEEKELIPMEDLSVLVEYTDFCIPPGADNYPVEAWYTFEYDSLLVSLHAHMHLRGKSMRIDAYYPNGEDETLLWVPKFDYDWQHVYQFRETKVIARGTRVHVIAHFDNSKDNPRNPAPEAAIVYGRGYYDEEMMAGTLNFVPLVESANTSLAEQRLTTGQVNHKYEPEEVQSLLAGYTKVEDVAPDKLAIFYHMRGLYREGLGDSEGALEDFNTAIDTDPAFSDAYLSRGKNHLAAMRPKPALQDFDKVIRLDPENFEAYTQRGRLTSNVQFALKHFAKAIELNPRAPEPYFYRGRLLEAAGDVPSAIENYATIIEDVHPGYTEAYIRRGEIMLSRGLDNIGMKDFDTIITRWPTRKTEVDFHLGTIRFNQQQFEEAIPHLEAFLRVVTDRVDVQKMLGIALVNVGRPSDAALNLRHVLDSTPDDTEVMLFLAQAYRNMAKDAETPEAQMDSLTLATSLLDGALEHSPENTEVMSELASTLVSQGNLVEAATHYRKILKLNPQSWPIANNLARILATSDQDEFRDPQEAISLAEGACQASQHANPGYLDTLAAAYAAAERFEEAQAIAGKAIDLAKKSGNQDQVKAITERLELYQGSQKYLDPSLAIVD